MERNYDCIWFHAAVVAVGTVSPALRQEKTIFRSTTKFPGFSAGTTSSVMWSGYLRFASGLSWTCWWLKNYDGAVLLDASHSAGDRRWSVDGKGVVAGMSSSPGQRKLQRKSNERRGKLIRTVAARSGTHLAIMTGKVRSTSLPSHGHSRTKQQATEHRMSGVWRDQATGTMCSGSAQKSRSLPGAPQTSCRELVTHAEEKDQTGVDKGMKVEFTDCFMPGLKLAMKSMPSVKEKNFHQEEWKQCFERHKATREPTARKPEVVAEKAWH